MASSDFQQQQQQLDSTRVDLQQLKSRLAKLGVHIQEPPPLQEQTTTTTQWESLAGTGSNGRSKNLAQLLGRCARVQQAIRSDDDSSSPEPPGDSKAGRLKEAAAAAVAAATAAGKHSARRKQAAADALQAERHTQPAAAGGVKLPESRHARGKSAGSTAAAAASSAAAAADSKLLVRAAQRLLEDAQEDAQQVSRSLRIGAAGGSGGSAGAARRAGAGAAGGAAAGRAAAAGGAGASGAGGGSGSSARKSSSTSAAAAGAASVDDLRNSPLGTVLAQYKEAQAAWAQEKGKLRREAVSARKEASAARLELARVSRSSEHRAQEASCLKAALKGRDVLLEELQGRVRQLEDEMAQCQEVAAERLVSVSRDRDDLQALLLATLERLEGVEAVVAATSAAMEEKVRGLEAERLAALEAAATARREVAELQEARRRLEWQSQLLEKMGKVQVLHNKRKSEALRELLNSTEAAADAAVAQCDAVAASPTARSQSAARDSCSKATAALQDLLDELLVGGTRGDGDESD